MVPGPRPELGQSPSTALQRRMQPRHNLLRIRHRGAPIVRLTHDLPMTIPLRRPSHCALTHRQWPWFGDAGCLKREQGRMLRRKAIRGLTSDRHAGARAGNGPGVCCFTLKNFLKPFRQRYGGRPVGQRPGLCCRTAMPADRNNSAQMHCAPNQTHSIYPAPSPRCESC